MSRKNEHTRTRILKAALALLESGTAVRMSDIARAAGISRQALYLHFPNRADLLIAATRYLDEISDTDTKLAASRSARRGTERLDAYIEAWGNHIPEVYGVARALLAMRDSDAEAATAWTNRMAAMREGCEAAVWMLARDRDLNPRYGEDQATDLLWTLLSVRGWELLRLECGWSQEAYVAEMKVVARAVLLPPPGGRD
ncbi:TetR/AcrR family transcriptional regulator [Rhodophyticola porphyridii]|uniref:TetR/AcrR family transcriptional regulator n=1 Tax=Rhodophyticola porphyridii TaxID=1852017 RepID=A0A3L9Y275_9RHOB|nr:TetR/AcrR family transcriptional regulator [Rhodophyticola porphyridii]RMA42931.1 TetR/AcrR family transcriptional regulator [Rhodophyticola porphyridii]